VDVKFLHATVLTQNERREVIDDGGVAVVGGRIAAVGRSAEIERTHATLPTVELSGKALLPGLVNAHTHVLLLALRGTVEDMGADAIYGYMSPSASR
jgi:5-methylthioadenosine/S-adenosylhomocysteine deaminase